MSYGNYNYNNQPASPGFASRRTSTTSSQATSTSGQSRTLSSNESTSLSFARDTFTLPSSSPTIIARPSSSNTFPDMPSMYSFDPLDIIDDLNYEDVDDGLIDHEMIHRRREAIVQELFVSEQKYLECLELICNHFLQPLTQTSKSSALKILSNKKPICTEREARWLFGNIAEILNIHKETLAIFEERLRIWGPTQIISDVFQAWFQKLGAYHAYLDNYSVAVTTYERLTRYQPFKKFIDNAHKDPQLNGKTLLTLLQAPAGCITRYVQLLSKLFEATSPMHPDYVGLRASKQRILDIFGEMNKKILDIQNVDHVLKIHQSLVGAPFGVKADRRLVLQDLITKSVSHSRTIEDERTYILFSDMLVIAKPKPDNTLHYKETINLDGATIRAEQDFGVEITSPFQGVDTLNTTFVGSATVHTFYTHNIENQQKWIRRLELVIEGLSRARAKAKLAAANKAKARSLQGNYLQ